MRGTALHRFCVQRPEQEGCFGTRRKPRRCSVSSSHLSPDNSGFVWFATRSHCVVLCLIHISTSPAWIEFCFILSINTFNFKKSCVLPLVPKTSLIGSKNGLGPQPSRHTCCFRSPVPSRPPQAPRWQSQPFCQNLIWHDPEAPKPSLCGLRRG